MHEQTQILDNAHLGAPPGWDLSALYSGLAAPELQADMTRANELALAFEQEWRGKLRQAAGENRLGAAIGQYEEIEELVGRITSFAGLAYATNTLDPARVKLYGDVQDRMTNASSHLIFFGLELNQIDDMAIEEALTRDQILARYRPWIEDLRKEKPFQLEDRVEQLFHEKSVTGRTAWNRLFDETIADLRFEIDGQSLTIEPTLNRLQSANADERKQAADALATTFGKHLRTFTLITNTLAKDLDISNRWRGFEDIADARHLSNRVEPVVVDALAKAVSNAYPRLSHRYYRMKARWLGMDRLNHWDRNAPLPDTSTQATNWDDARNIVLSAYHAFSPDLAAIAARFFDENWIDAPVRPGKAPGAFAHPTVPSAHPYVMLNYLGKPRDVMTLAHELGHGVHQVLAGSQGALMAQTPLTLAETASVFGEMLTFQSLLSAAADPRQRKALLAQKVEDMLNTVVRQIAFYQFEQRLHAERADGELTTERIGEIWLGVQAESLGDAIALQPGYETFWTYIPHFVHSPFYVYAYAFGDCLVNSLYAVYEAHPEGFQDKYLAMLRAGGSKHHTELLAPFGLDATQPDFWNKGLSVIEKMIDELEKIDAQAA